MYIRNLQLSACEKNTSFWNYAGSTTTTTTNRKKL